MTDEIALSERISARMRDVAAILEDIPAGTVLGSTERFLSSIVAKPGDAFDARERKTLDRLCRKIDIARRVWADYDPDWNKPLTERKLPTEFGPALVLAFLRRARECARGTPDDKGRALKFTNTALNAIDLCCGEADDTRKQDLMKMAAGQLRELLPS
jgi:hypothetical protein